MTSAPENPEAGFELASKRHPRSVENNRPDPPEPDSLSSGQAARRERIIDTAYRLLEHHPYDAIQMRDVADHAQVALGTVYRYFASKEHLFAWAMLKWASGLEDRMERVPLKGQTVPERLNDVYARVIDAFDRSPQFFQLMMVLESTADPHAQEVFMAFNSNAAAALADPIQQLESELSMEIAEVLMAVLNGVLRSWSIGQTEIEDAHKRMRRTISLIFSPPPDTD